MKTKLRQLTRFLSEDVWRIRASDLPRRRFLPLRYLRVFLLSVRGFRKDHCGLRASALTLYTILSIVPVVAMTFGVAKGFGFEKQTESHIREALADKPEVVEWILNFSRSALEGAKGGLMAGVGVVILLWTVIKVLGNIEESFNHIWGVQKHRSLLRKFTDYLSMMIVCPVLLVLLSSMTVVLKTQVDAIMTRFAILGAMGPVIYALLRLVPLVIGWVLFGLMYVFMPNTRVRVRSALIAGIVAGSLFYIMQVVYITFQIGVNNYGAIYGSFAALPLFLIWLQTSWLIVLFGAEFSFAHQNVDTYEYEPDCLRASLSFKRLLALRVAQIVVKNFEAGRGPLTAEQIREEVETPIRLVNELLFDLARAGVLSETRFEDDDRKTGYQPARDIATLTAACVIRALDQRGTADVPVKDSPEMKRLSKCVDSMRDAMRDSPANVALKDL